MVLRSPTEAESGSQEQSRTAPGSGDEVTLIVGLGNPGLEYQFTPHNLGFLALDRIANDHGVEIRNRQCRAVTARTRIGQMPVVLAKPETYMNLSGLAVQALVEKLAINPHSSLIVIYDELDLPMGTIRIQERGSSAGHNGMKSIIGTLGTQEFLRIRIGIAPEKRVLRPFPKSHLKQVDEVLQKTTQAVEVVLTEGRAAAMNRYNRRPEPPTTGL